ncbi:MAG: PEP-CTERM sorting domain-containing protein [Desulfococcaceae bacterium]
MASADTLWATDVAWEAGNRAKMDSFRANTDNALGSPDKDNAGDKNFLSLGLGGHAIFDFGAEFAGTVEVVETTWGNRGGHKEFAEVWVAGSGFDFDAYVTGEGFPEEDFVFAGQIDNQDAQGYSAVDLTGLSDSPFRYVAILDRTGGNKDGFDVNAVGVSPVQVNPTPEPGAILLFGMGLAGLYTVRRRKG